MGQNISANAYSRRSHRDNLDPQPAHLRVLADGLCPAESHSRNITTGSEGTVMNRVESNAAPVTPAATTSPHRDCGTAPIGKPQFESHAKLAPAAVSPAPILITEKEIVFSTAAAVQLRPTTLRGWREATGVVLAALHQMWMTSAAHDRRPRQDYPRRYAFLEYSCLAREMDRL